MSVEEFDERLFGLCGVGAFESVAGTFEREQFGFDRCGLELVDQPDGLLMRDILVVRAVDAERRGRIRRDPIQRAALNVQRLVSAQVAAEPQWQNLVSIDALAVRLREIARSLDLKQATPPTLSRRFTGSCTTRQLDSSEIL